MSDNKFDGVEDTIYYEIKVARAEMVDQIKQMEEAISQIYHHIRLLDDLQFHLKEQQRILTGGH